MPGYVPFLAAGSILVLGFMGMAWQALVVTGEPTELQRQFVNMCEWLIVGSFGFMFGRWSRGVPSERNAD